MSFQHLTQIGNEELARLLIGAAKTIFAASVVALFFPAVGAERSWIWFLSGIVVAAILGGVGIVMLESASKKRGGTDRWSRRSR
jgi:hypothetical protein